MPDECLDLYSGPVGQDQFEEIVHNTLDSTTSVYKASETAFEGGSGIVEQCTTLEPKPRRSTRPKGMSIHTIKEG